MLHCCERKGFSTKIASKYCHCPYIYHPAYLLGALHVVCPAYWASQVALGVKNLDANAGHIRDAGSIPGSGRSLGEGMATHSSILAWKILWTQRPGRLQSIGSQGVRHNWSDLATWELGNNCINQQLCCLPPLPLVHWTVLSLTSDLLVLFFGLIQHMHLIL